MAKLGESISAERDVLSWLAAEAFSSDSDATFESVASEIRVSKSEVGKLLKHAIRAEIGSSDRLKKLEPDETEERLAERFPGAIFLPVYSRRSFGIRAVIQVFEWLSEIVGEEHEYKKIQLPDGFRPMVAIGGGLSMNLLAKAITEPVKKFLSKSLDLLRERETILVNATAGGHAKEPDFNSSFLSCFIGELTNINSYLYSSQLDDQDREVCEAALTNTVAICTGLGGRYSYCRKTIKESKAEIDQISGQAGEMSFQVFQSNKSGRIEILRERVRIIEEFIEELTGEDAPRYTLRSGGGNPGVSKRIPDNTEDKDIEDYKLSSLFAMQNLNRPLIWEEQGGSKKVGIRGRKVICVVGPPQGETQYEKVKEAETKAFALASLLDCGVLSHVVLDAGISRALLDVPKKE